MTRKFFGTDGVRGRVGEMPMRADWVLQLGWAAGRVLTRGVSGRPQVLIGKDTRLSGYLLESALESGLAAAGVDVLLVGPLPTPAIAYLTRTLRAHAGIVISASHNPYEDNGIKFFSGDGYKLPDAVEEAIEAELEEPMRCAAADSLGKARRVDDAAGRYVEYCKTTFPASADLRGLRIVVDAAHGAGYKVAPMVFSELGAQVESIGARPNGVNINDGVGSTAPQALIAAVQERQADLGIALDGDGDRVLLVDARGNAWDGDAVLWLLAQAFQERGVLSGVVGTVMSNLALEKALTEQGVPFVRSAVGDRYVLETMRRLGYPLGGENSGHLITPANTTGDAILAALQVLAFLQQKGRSLHELADGLKLYPQVLRNLRLPDARQHLERPDVQQLLQAAEAQLAGRGRLLVRASGTEPLLRIMVEATESWLAQSVAEELQAQVAACVTESAAV
ncbi:phosphoglucosamine mutase [Acidithiobacillus sp. AMEEHan]|uniref:phosphoglucosamine mutase n=1 Tax=Acidithiobacillus sp. AMEEHan TaxID=2994951 RepID=UPI0027E55842|nr:phosphoglucosamine mutase [Acidithiobacillus sp. AMEEHan]